MFPKKNIIRPLTLTLLVAVGLSPCFTQTLSLRDLPKPARVLLEDFLLIPGDTFFTNLREGHDSLQFLYPKRIWVDSFYMHRFEVSVEKYLTFFWETRDAQNQYDSTVWETDFPYSYNKPLTQHYFNDPGYRSYPVIGITWKHAQRYCQWLANKANTLLANTRYQVEIRLPTDTEWQFAASGPMPPSDTKIYDRRTYPWDGGFFKHLPSSRIFELQCNSGPTRTPEGSYLFYYPEDGALYTAPVKSYNPNEYGLYQMAGNVAEWTLDYYSVDTIGIANAQRVFNDAPEALKMFTPAFPYGMYDTYKIVKGGSWASGPFYMQIGVLQIQCPDRASSTVGFRPVLRIYRK